MQDSPAKILPKEAKRKHTVFCQSKKVARRAKNGNRNRKTERGDTGSGLGVVIS